MKINKWELTVIILSMGIIGFCFFYIRNKTEAKLWQLKSVLLEEQFKIAEFKDIQNYSLNSEGLILSDTIKKVLPDNVCVLRLHDGICLSCYAENLLLLEKKMNQVEDIRLFVLGSYNFTTQLKEELASVNMSKVKSINILAHDILPADSIGRPYLFFLNKKGMVKNLYFFQKEDYASIDVYLRAIQRIKSSQD